MDVPFDSLGALLERRGRARALGHAIVTLEETDSTNDYASSIARSGAPHGTVVVAKRQKAGRGRWQRAWESPLGGLYLTLILRDDRPPGMSLLPLAASVASAEAVHEASGVSATIRWPNDLMVAGKKLGGILCEAAFSGARLDFALVGIGINVNQDLGDFSADIASKVTSLKIVTGLEQDWALTAVCLIEAMERWWATSLRSSREVRDRWMAHAEGARGARVRVHPKGAGAFLGVTDGIDEDGSLRVLRPDGEMRRLYAEEVTYLEPADGEEMGTP